MAGNVVNLRQFRKQKTRAEKDATAEQNRISFGRTKAEKQLTKTINEKAVKSLDQRKLDPAAKANEIHSPAEDDN